MKKFSDKLFEILAPVASKFSTQRHLVAIRDGFITVMPLVIIASFYVLINNVILDSNIGLLKGLGNFDQYKDIGLSVYYGTLGFLSIFIAFAVSYKLANHYEMNELTTGFIATAAVVSIIPTTIAVGGTELTVSGVFSETFTSPTGLFVAIIVSIIATELLRVLDGVDKLKIKMPDVVPPSVSKSFNVLIPGLITLTVVSVFSFLLIKLSGNNIYDIITTFIQTPIKMAFQGMFGVVLVVIFQSLLWCFGLHGSFILSPILEPTLLTAIQENMSAFQLGQEIPNIVTKPFLDVFVNMGGVGVTLGLIIAIILVSKRADYRSVSKLSAVPGLFNINEPIMFGLPVVLNPVLMIPLILAPVVNVLIAYFATATGLIEKTVVMVPWTTPPVLSAYLATGGDWKAAILSIILIAISIIIYLPFVYATNNMENI